MVSREVVLDKVDAIMIRNDQFPADWCPQVEILGIKGFVEEWVTFPYTLLERFPKLNELRVKNGSFEKIFPSHAPSSTSFHNLTVLKVSKCHHLVYLVTCSAVKSLVNLETLEIDDCKKLEEIVRNETDEDVEGGITFNGLRILKLTHLPRLKTHEDKRDFNIENRATNIEYTNVSRSLFSQKKVLIPKLEILELSYLLNNLVSLIWDDQLLHNSFSNVKTLIVESCDFMKSVPLRVLKSLTNLEKMEVSNCDKLKMVFDFEDLNDYHKEMESLSMVVPLSLTHLEVKWCRGLTTLMTSSAASSLVHITHLSISYCDRIEEIIMKLEGEDDEDKEIVFNKMKCLELGNLPRLKRFCRHNYTFRFPLLDKLIITRCPKFTSFSPGLVDTPSFESLHLSQDWREHPEIWDINLNKACCEQRYVTSRELVLDDEDDARMIRNDQFPVDCCPQVEILRIKGFVEEWFTFPYTLLERFPKLNELHVENCSFEEIFPSHAPSSTSFHNLAMLKVSKCHQLVYLVTCSTVKSLVNLETLEVDNCEKMEEIVRNDTDEDAEGGITFNGLKILKLTHLPNLKTQEDKKDFNIEDRATNTRCTSISRLLFSHNKVLIPKLKILKLSNLNSLIPLIWDDQLSHNSFNNLKILTVNRCGFEKLIPFHVLKSLNNLEELDVEDCYMLEKVFDFEDLNDYKEMELTSVVVPLKKLKLSNLPKLKNVWSDHYQGNVSFPSLWSVDVFNCKNLTSIFSLLSHDKVIGNLERLTLQGREVEKIGSGQFLMYQFPKLKLLHLSLEKESPFPSLQFRERSPNLGELQLSGDFGGDDVAALAARFPKLTLEKISIMGSLSPSLVSSPNPTHLNVKRCDEWTTLMTSSIARSLVHLTHLSVGCCGKMEEIVTKQEGEDDENKEIIFIKLKFLELEELPRLKSFCALNYTFKFLLLDQLIIKECPKFKIFSHGLIETPSLKSVQLWEDWGKHHEIWDTDLNKTFYRQRYVTSRELVLYEHDAIMIRDDQFPADCCPQVEILGIEGFVEEWVTFPYTLLKRFPKLNALHVNNCSFEEIIPSHAPSSTSFHNLTVLKVFKCHQLVYLVTGSTVKSLVNLETLEVDDCEKMEGIVRNETDEDVEWEIIFNALRILKLTRLPKLKTQKNKKDFNIEDSATNIRCTSISRSLFSHNKVLLPKLEILELSNLANNSVSLIWDDKLLHNSFSNVKTLIVKSCEIMKSVPLRVLKSLTNLEEMKVSYCHKLEKVFGFEDLNDYYKEMESSSVVVPLSLTHLEVKKCRGLTTLMTSAAAPSLVHITHLSISSCNQIEEIITKQEGEDDENREIFFNKMKFLELGHLPRLKRFCGYNYTFKFSLLEHVTIIGCPQLTMFCPRAIHAPQLQSVAASEHFPNKRIWMTDLNNTIQHLFTFEEVNSTTRSMALNGKNIRTVMGVFPKVRTLYVESFTDEGVTFPYSFLKRFPQLNELYVEHCSFGEIFPSQDRIIDFMVKISPFKDLRRLSISGCHQLIYLITTSTAKSLVGLRWLEINACKKMEEIVMNETNEDVESGITFGQLQKIKLTDMPSLKLFSSQNHTYKFPELEKIKIIGCPEMKMFCQGVFEMPKLSKVKIEKHGMEWKDEGDLNKTIEMLSPAKGSINV